MKTQDRVLIKLEDVQTSWLPSGAPQDRLQTKSKHVDIHGHWLRQEVQRETIERERIGTADMITDGPTKALTKQKFEIFRKQVNLADVTDRINAIREAEDEGNGRDSS